MTTLFKDKKNGSGDIFDQISLDIFDQIDLPRMLKNYVPPPQIQVKLSEEIRNMIRAEIGTLLKEEVRKTVSEIKPHTVETKTVERVVEKPVEKTIIKEVVDEIRLKKTIEESIKKAKEDLEKDGKLDLFIPAPIPLPNMEGQSGKVLSNDGRNARWIASAAGSSESYTTSNGTTQRTLDADDTSLDELADVVASLIEDFKTAGLLQ